MENKQYTRDEVYGLMCKAFEHGFKKYDVVDAGLESKETDIECAWILHKYDIESKKKVMGTKQTAVEWLIIELDLSNDPITMKAINKAKDMEKNQIIDGIFAGYNYDGARLEEYAEQYYNKTYNL